MAEAGCAAESQGLPAAPEGGRAQEGPPGSPAGACFQTSGLWHCARTSVPCFKPSSFGDLFQQP